MKQITDSLNDIAVAINPEVELPQSKLIVDSLDAITKAYGGTPTQSNLIVDKLDDIAQVATVGSSEPGTIIPAGTLRVEQNGDNIDVAEYAHLQVAVSSEIYTRKISLNTTGGNVAVKYVAADSPQGYLGFFSHSSGNYTECYVGIDGNGDYILYLYKHSNNFTLDESSTGCEILYSDAETNEIWVRILQEFARVVIKGVA